MMLRWLQQPSDVLSCLIAAGVLSGLVGVLSAVDLGDHAKMAKRDAAQSFKHIMKSSEHKDAVLEELAESGLSHLVIAKAREMLKNSRRKLLIP